MKKVLVLGGDGFCGWPTSLHLSDLGHEVVIVDNLSRRDIDQELGTASLTPIATTTERLDTWNKLSGKKQVRATRGFARGMRRPSDARVCAGLRTLPLPGALREDGPASRVRCVPAAASR